MEPVWPRMRVRKPLGQVISISPSSLASIGEKLRESLFEDSAIAFDPQREVFQLTLWCAAPENAIVQPILWCLGWKKVPMKEWHLSIKNVMSCKVVRQDACPVYEISTL